MKFWRNLGVRMPDSAMIFAAGFGTRMGALTKDQPKPMVQVANRPLIDYALDLTADAGVTRTVVNLHYLPDQIEQHLTGRPNVATIAEPVILETGGGLKNALPLLGKEPVFTLNSDAVWTGSNPLTALNAAWDADRMDALLMLIPIDFAQEHTGPGDFSMNNAGRLARRGGASTAPYVYSGVQIIKTTGLAAIDQDVFSLNLLWTEMLAAKRVFGIIHDGGWVDVGRPEGIEVAQEELRLHV